MGSGPTAAAKRSPTVMPKKRDSKRLRVLADALSEAAAHDETPVVRAGEHEVPLPPGAAALLLAAAAGLAEGRTVTVLAADAEVGTQEAADLLGVSRPYLVKLLDAGELPCRMVGNRHRVLAADVLAYKQARDRKRERALRRLSRLTEDLEPQF